MGYPNYRTRSSSTAGTTSYFYIPEAGVIQKIKATDSAYIYVGPYTGSESEDQLIGATDSLDRQKWIDANTDLSDFANRVGSSPIIRPPH